MKTPLNNGKEIAHIELRLLEQLRRDAEMLRKIERVLSTVTRPAKLTRNGRDPDEAFADQIAIDEIILILQGKPYTVVHANEVIEA